MVTSELHNVEKVSVIVPLYNARATISRAINSILAQSHKVHEIIIIDDNSNDGSREVVLEISQKIEKIKLLENDKNLGASYSRNLGIKWATGDYIAFLDSDDFWYQDKILVQLMEFRTSDADIVCSNFDIVNDDFHKIGVKISPKKITFNDLLKHNPIGCSTAMYSVRKLGKKYMPNIRKRQDYAFWLQLSKQGACITNIQSPLVAYTRGRRSLSSNKIEMFWWNFKMFYRVLGYPVSSAFFLTLRNTYYKLFI